MYSERTPIICGLDFMRVYYTKRPSFFVKGRPFNSLTFRTSGSITVKSRYGEGSEFTVCIPQKIVDPTPVGKINIGQLTAGDAAFSHKQSFIAPSAKILVVDDVPVNINVFVNLVKSFKMQVDTAMSGQECLALTQKKQYDIIFMDHMMPEMDGIETLENIKADENNPNRNTTVIMLTANALIGMKEMYIKKGFTDYLTKPIVPNKLEKTISGYLSDDKKIAVSETEETESVETALSDIQNPLERIKILIPDANLDMAIVYCGRSEEIYIEFLKDYIGNGRYERILAAYEKMDLKQYAMEVHTLKSSSKTLGFDKLSKLAGELQLAADKDDEEAVRRGHEPMIELYRNTLTALEKVF